MPLQPEQHVHAVSTVRLVQGEQSLDCAVIYWLFPHYCNRIQIPAALSSHATTNYSSTLKTTPSSFTIFATTSASSTICPRPNPNRFLTFSLACP